MVQERFTELEHAAGGDRMDTREWLLQKANVLNKLDRLVWYNGSTATYRNRAWCSSQNGHKRVACTESKRFTETGQVGTMVQERLTEVKHAAEVSRMDTTERLSEK